MKKFAVILAGCGRKDGAEINEAVTLLLALDQQGVSYQCFAPNRPQKEVVNHLTNEIVPDETRNILVEAARIARGKILPIEQYHAKDYDALVFSGGYGVAKNLCDYAYKGAEMTVMPDVERAIMETHKDGKAIGGMCISPVLFARLIPTVHLTLGNDATADADNARAMGAEHIQTEHGDVVIDNEEKVFTTPCYMLDATLSDVYDGAANLVEAMLDSMDESRDED